MSRTSPTPVLLTHSGTFHCDDAFAYATLRLALGLSAPGRDHALVRTREKAQIADADIVFDVGAEYDAEAGRFDHHQRDAPVRGDDGVPYSAAGLIWQVHGTGAVHALLPAEHADEAAAMASAIDDELVRRIDTIDNGVAHPGDTLGLSSLVEDFNSPWDSGLVGDGPVEDAAFVQAADMMRDVLRRRVMRVRARLAADAAVVAAHARSADPRILELDRKVPWQDAVFAHDSHHRLDQAMTGLNPSNSNGGSYNLRRIDG